MNFQKKILKNGITVIHESRNLPVVSLSITNRFGAGFEESNIKGIAHVIEHLLFTGTKTRSHEDISKEIEKKGGILNAFTAHEVTSFWFKLPSQHLQSGLDILTDMINNPAFPEEKFEKEKKVILEEIKMYHDNPRRYAFEQIEKNLYEKPFGELVIGNKESITSLQRNQVISFYKEVYNPKNFIITMVGDANFEEVCSFLEKSFQANNKTQAILPIIKKNAETTEERPGIDQAHFVFAFHAPLPTDPNHAALEVLDAYLASGMSSRLFLEIREKRGLAYNVSSTIDAEKSYANYIIYAGTTKEAIPEIKKIILKEFNDVQNMTSSDLQQAKERVIGLKQVTSEESINVMNELMFAELANNAENFYKYETKIKDITLEKVKEIAKIKEYSTAAIVPK